MSTSPSLPEIPTSPLRVLIVEDHDNLRNLLTQLLRMEDDFGPCLTARTAEQALEHMRESEPDIALIDLFLPGMDGFQLIAHIKQKYPKTCCVVLSGYAEKEFVDLALEAGASGYIVKDHPHELIEGLRHAHAGGIYLSHAVHH